MLAGFLVLLACCCWGLDNHLTALIDGLTPSQSTFWKGLVAGSVNTALGLALATGRGDVVCGSGGSSRWYVVLWGQYCLVYSGSTAAWSHA